jgi:hypothetical protein
MRKLLFAIVLLAGCNPAAPEGGGNASGGGRGQGAGPAGQPEDAEEEGDAGTGAPRRLTGLWESGTGPRRSQLCMVEKDGKAQFGINIAGPNMLACQGIGTAARQGESLTLELAGDQSCTLTARVSGRSVAISAAAGNCGYYCGAGVGFEGAAFTRAGSRAADALKAKDVLGEPLCPAAG